MKYLKIVFFLSYRCSVLVVVFVSYVMCFCFYISQHGCVYCQQGSPKKKKGKNPWESGSEDDDDEDDIDADDVQPRERAAGRRTAGKLG